jgi:hypothetical protein
MIDAEHPHRKRVDKQFEFDAAANMLGAKARVSRGYRRGVAKLTVFSVREMRAGGEG